MEDKKRKLDVSNSDGTSIATGESKNNENKKSDSNSTKLFGKDKKPSVMQRLKQIKRAANTANLAIRTYMILKVLDAIKKFISAIVHAAQGFWAMVMSYVMPVINFIATVFNVTVATATILLTGFTSFISITIGVVVYAVSTASDPAVRDDYVDCGQSVLDATVASDIGDVNVEVEQEAVAKQIYSVFKEYGLTDIQIAGILGNFEAESNLDPTIIEGIYNEPYTMGPRKLEASKDFEAYCINFLFPHYRERKVQHNPNGYKGNDGKYYPGLGLGQASGGRINLLIDFAKANNRNWWETDVQLAFYISGDHQYRRDWLLSDWGNPKTPEEAGKLFSHKWEGNTVHAQDKRQKAAAKWYARMGEWEIDKDYANSVLDLAKTAKKGAIDNGTGRELNKCLSSKKYDNSDIARAILSYAWPRYELGINNNGTDLYFELHEKIFPGDWLCQSCDRSVAVGVRWSGADDNFPYESCMVQYTYMKANPDKWKEIDWGGDISKLEPGDILVLTNDPSYPGVSHILAFVGEELAKEFHGDEMEPGSQIVHGSIGDYVFTNKLNGKHNVPGLSRSPTLTKIVGVPYFEHYHAFRNIKKETNSKYKNIAANSNGYRK